MFAVTDLSGSDFCVSGRSFANYYAIGPVQGTGVTNDSINCAQIGESAQSFSRFATLIIEVRSYA